MASAGGYDARVTELCERALVTVIGNAGFWGRHLYLVGGLVPRYLVDPGSTGASTHVGSRDVDLAVVLAIDSAATGAYETLEKNLRDSGFRQAPGDGDPEFRWRREIDGQSLILEFRARARYGTVTWPGDVDMAPETLIWDGPDPEEGTRRPEPFLRLHSPSRASSCVDDHRRLPRPDH